MNKPTPTDAIAEMAGSVLPEKPRAEKLPRIKPIIVYEYTRTELSDHDARAKIEELITLINRHSDIIENLDKWRAGQV